MQPSAAVVDEPEELPEVKVPTPEQMEAALSAGDLAPLPDDAVEDRLVAEGAPQGIVDAPRIPLPGVVVGATLARELDLKLGYENLWFGIISILAKISNPRRTASADSVAALEQR